MPLYTEGRKTNKYGDVCVMERPRLVDYLDYSQVRWEYTDEFVNILDGARFHKDTLGNSVSPSRFRWR